MPIEVHQVIRTKRKTLALIVKSDGSLIVRAPLRTPQKIIIEFIESHTDWIQKSKPKH